MDELSQVIIDLKAVLVEDHRDFQLLNFYKGVPVICYALLESAQEEATVFTVQAPSSAVLLTQKNTTLLSGGLLEPIHAQIASFDLPSGRATLTGLYYAGSKFANRQELRVEPASPLEVALEAGGHMFACEMVDISMRGVGLRLPSVVAGEGLDQGKAVTAILQMPDGMISLPGRIRNLSRSSNNIRISIEFTAEVHGKVHVVRFIMRRRAEIFTEIQQLHAQHTA